MKEPRNQQRLPDASKETDRQAAELDTIIKAMGNAVLIFDAKGQVVRTNLASINLFGIDPLGMTGEEFADVLSARNPDGSPLALEDLPAAQVLRSNDTIIQHLLFLDSEGNERQVHISASPLTLDEHSILVITVWHDVTEREQLLEQLEVEQSRLQTIIENAPEAIVVTDEEGQIVLVNPAAGRIFGAALLDQKDLSSYAHKHIFYPDGTPYNPRNLPLVCSALDGEWILNIELLVQPPGEEQRVIISSSAPIVDRKGNLNGAVGVFQDITSRKQAEEMLRQQARRSELLAALSNDFAKAGLNYKQVLETIIERVGREFGDYCSLHLFTDDGKFYYPAAVYVNAPPQPSVRFTTLDREMVSAGHGLVGQVLRNGHTLVLEDAAVDVYHEVLSADFLPRPGSHLAGQINGVSIPLRAHGRWIGVLNVLRITAGSRFQPEDVLFLEDLSDRAALAIEDARLYEQEAQRAQELQSLHQAVAALLSTIDLETMLARIVDSACRALPSTQYGVLYLWSDENQEMEVRAAYGGAPSNLHHQTVRRYIARALEEKRSLLMDSLLTREAVSQPYSALIAPLVAPGGISGALVLFTYQPGQFDENSLRLLDSFAITAAAALQNATLYNEIQRLATIDTLTGQYNRRKFFELGDLEMHRFHRYNTPLTAIMFDLDNFKEINDTYGHAAGDIVLEMVAQRGRTCIRVIDILGRYGGDEFAILLPNAGMHEAEEIAARIRLAITSRPIQTPHGDVTVSVSLGIAEANQGTESLSSLLGRADAALYAAKQNGRNRIELG